MKLFLAPKFNGGGARRLLALVSAACFVSALTASAQDSAALLNVSTRGNAGSGDNVMIAGFIIEGSAPRNIAVRVLGPSLINYNVQGTLADPTLTLNSGGTDIATNDDWKLDTSSAAALTAAGLGLTSDRESGLVRSLAPGAYTVIVAGKASQTGVVLVEVYDLDARNGGTTSSRLVNLSTRGRVGSGDSVMIMGFIVGGSARDLLVTAVGAALAEYGVGGVLADPKIEIFNAGGQKIAESDDWIESPDFDTIARTGVSPRDPLASAVWLHLEPGGYTAVVSGAKGTQGVALPEVYEIRGLGDVHFAPGSLGGRSGKFAISTGAAPEQINFSFGSSGSATVNGGAAGTFKYTATDGFRGTLTLDASGYAFTGKVQFYRDNVAVFDGTLKKPGGTAQTAGGIFILD